MGESVLLERTAELAQIERTLDHASAGEGGLLYVEGPPGIGKTALLNAARGEAERRDMVALVARGGELEGHFPYGLVRQLFEPTVRQAGPQARRRLLAGAAELAGPLLTGSGELANSPREDTPYGVTHGLFWLALNLSQRAPLLMAVDDVHWADAPSLRFLVHLRRRLEGTTIALMISMRSGEPGLEPDLTAELARQTPDGVMRPVGLSERGVERLLRSGLGQTPDGSFAAACHSATGGVPFLVHELVAALAADEIEPTASQAPRVQELGPRTVAQATLVRLGRMSDGCLALARAVAALAGAATLPRSAKLAGLERSAALTALDELVEVRLLEAGAGLRFAHPVVRAAVYDELTPGKRSELHLEAARLLSAEGAELDSVAAQLLASEPIGSQETVEQLRAAASLALSRGAPEDAIAYLRRALAEGCDRELRAAVSYELGLACKVAGRWERIESFKEARRLAGDPVLRNSAALELATALIQTSVWDEPMALVEEALTDLGTREPELTVRLECLRAGLAGADPRRVQELDPRLPQLRRLAKQGGGPARSLALLLAAIAAWRGSDADEIADLVGRGFEDDHPLAAGVEPWALGQGLAGLAICERLDRAAELAGVLLSEALALGSIAGFVLGTATRGFVEARSGRLGPAEEALRTSLEPAREARFPFALASQLWFATDVILEREEAGDLAAFVKSLELGPLAELHTGAMLLDVRGRIREAAGERPAAIADLRHAGETFAALGIHNPNASSWRSALALMIAADDRAEAKRLANAELEAARKLGHARAHGVALRTLGLLEGGDKGRKRLEESIRVLEGTAAHLEHARALVELGAALRRSGERAAAREPLRAGLDIAAGGGATRLAERARTELSASGGRPRRTRLSGLEALTPSELRVARLAATGRTNNEIAQALFVTPKTVDTHLSHTYSKLGIASRRALASLLDDGEEPREAPAGAAELEPAGRAPASTRS
jgi:DNA-binding CsgD family transcriptional regulator